MRFILSPCKTFDLKSVVPGEQSIPSAALYIQRLLYHELLKNETDFINSLGLKSERIKKSVSEMLHKRDLEVAKAIDLYSGVQYKPIRELYAEVKDQDYDLKEQILRICVLSTNVGISLLNDKISPLRADFTSKYTIPFIKQWREYVTRTLECYMVLEEDQKLYLNLASQEYSALLDRENMRFPIYDVVFKRLDNKKISSTLLKQLRGEFVCVCIKNYITNMDELKDIGLYIDPNYHHFKDIEINILAKTVTVFI